jgi:hypothetical protein
MVRRIRFRRSVAQWLEHRSPKPGVAGSSPATPARDRPAAERSFQACANAVAVTTLGLTDKVLDRGLRWNGNVSIQVSPGSARRDAQGDLAVTPRNGDYNRHGFRDGGDRVGFLPCGGSNYPHCGYLRARHRNLKVQEA